MVVVDCHFTSVYCNTQGQNYIEVQEANIADCNPIYAIVPHQSDCNYPNGAFATPSATQIASSSASPSAELLSAYGQFARVEIIGVALVIFLLSVLVFLNVFKR